MASTYAIKEIRIKEFKSIADITLDLGKVNVLIGENGAGKSNILEAIGVISAAIAGNTNYSSLKERGVRLSAPEVFKMALCGRKRKPLFTLETLFTSGLRYHLTLSPARNDTGDKLRYWTEVLSNTENKIVSRGVRGKRGTIVGKESFTANENTSVVLAAESLNVISEEYKEEIDILRNYAIYAPSTPILRNISPDESAKSPLGLYGGGLANSLPAMFRIRKFVQLYSSIVKLFPWIDGFGRIFPAENLISHYVHPDDRVIAFRDRRMSDNFNKLLAYDISEGVLYVLFLFTLILHTGAPNFFAIDNIDSALNPGLSTKVLDMCIDMIKKSSSKQIILTTHNPSMINGLDLFDDEQRLFVVERNKDDGSTIVRRINPAAHISREKWNAMVHGQSLSHLWTSGALGGIPTI